ncbi:hypothetical protein PISL3812_03030 [Talaromyces islandicus]|uniref:Uncharacterized protein n=1 Tax=Talaromyces islandicus TaxID=28573 RepID=A0A0U1LRJ4_TALIS|nr:hypothetical protein PISL3812_03030 [Talaromyces islandicus]
MRFPAFSVLVGFLLAPLSQALSDNANQILAHQATISQELQANKDAIDKYQGGLWGAAELAWRNYDTWASLRLANADLDKSKLSSEDSEAITKNLDNLNNAAIDTMNAFTQKVLSSCFLANQTSMIS